MSNEASFQDSPWQEFSGHNLGYVMELYEKYLEDPSSVDPEMKEVFDKWGAPSTANAATTVGQADVSFQMPAIHNQLSKIVAAVKYADNIRTYGHLIADINPIRRKEKNTRKLELSEYNLTEADLKQIPASFISPNAPSSLKDGYEAIEHLKEVYTKKLAFEYHHVHELDERNWLQQKIEEGVFYPKLTKERKKALLTRLSEVEGFEKFIHRTFVGQKRFSIEGLEALVPLMDKIISLNVEKGTRTINIGMAHRGRLNVLAHVLEKPYELIFSEFQHAPNKELIPSEGSIGITYGWTGDVKYHLGADRKLKRGNTATTRITLANNPSHLEVVNPVVDGFTRAAQENRNVPGYPEQDMDNCLAIVVHGDAAFPGEGIVQETLNMGRLRGYNTGGSIHIIANNMIGFTTESRDSRSTLYASDVAKGFEVPIVHVNADDPEAVLAAATLAHEYRQNFHKDFIIDLIGYRRFGHNEMDEPMVTNPIMYNMIKNHKTIKEQYAEQLLEEGHVTKEEIKQIDEKIQESLQKAYDKVPKTKDNPDIVMNPPEYINKLPKVQTAVNEKILSNINDELLKWPDNFHVFGRLKRILQRRENVFKEKGKIDWAHAEALAFGSILKDGTPIRLTGQDSQRGTFAQRNLVLHDVKTGEEYIPMHHLSDVNSSFVVYNSPLTEAAVVGFEYGYNVFAPETLVLWEAQFGDFANMAQVYFDQFISSGRAKWGQKSGLVMLLPHGYEGQGPEHSSGRVERFLQSAAENNWIVANLSTAAQYFHILRRQAAILKKDEVKPLVLMTPKSLLRHPLAAADVEELTNGEFRSIIEQKGLGEKAETVERIILCSGKVSIDLEESLKDADNTDWIHILRVEELYPFPKKEITNIISRYPNVKELVWVQEEPKNMGGWSHAVSYLWDIAPEGVDVKYIGRRKRSSPSEGDPTVHRQEQSRIINEALTKNN
ncbi:2-oxoglutarate dehydrogenase E1 component [Bacillus thermophilus]|uniref:2-oxoglutarate dehydrogenase E1 component n=1 Tax=Siminovitchia thermophila TaxID=1245522 RepID=A0ABS2RDG1_9BACI|nr:2-oxoglutarate dehydrogenase E1 component [Siminovitchia thermophila]MBM7716611.1 2-oxoglutarate dehydrogenase E1 component [Siminovitchia thermophila]ONK22945.1 2-oxoglutarate dehydrogenase E1 component [Bacillus sp. VT-16-64]